MIKLLNINNLKITKFIISTSFIIISSINTNLLESEIEDKPAVFEFAKISRIQPNYQNEQINKEQKASDNKKAFSGHMIDTEIAYNIDNSGNIWIRNILIDDNDNILSSNWHVYSIAGFFIGKFDKFGCEVEETRGGDMWDFATAITPNLIYALVEGSKLKYSTSHIQSLLDKETGIVQKKELEIINLNEKLEKKEEKISEIKAEYEAKLEKKKEKIQEITHDSSKKLSDSQSEHNKQLFDLQNEQNRQTLQLKSEYELKLEKKDDKIQAITSECSKKLSDLQAEYNKQCLQLKSEYESKLEKKDNKIQELNDKLVEVSSRSK